MKGQEQDKITGKIEPRKQTPVLKTRKIYIHKSKLLHSSKQYSGGHKRISYVVLLSIDGSEEHFFFFFFSNRTFFIQYLNKWMFCSGKNIAH